MSMDQFSKGPWHVSEIAGTVVRDANGDRVAEINIWKPEEVANARLLAASWEILRMLKEAHDYGDISCISEDWHTRADALIARVEGREVQG